MFYGMLELMGVMWPWAAVIPNMHPVNHRTCCLCTAVYVEVTIDKLLQEWSVYGYILTSINKRRPGASHRPGPRSLSPQADHPAQLGRLGKRRKHLPTEQSQVVLWEGAISFQRYGGALRPPQLPAVWRLLLLQVEKWVLEDELEGWGE